MTNAEQSPRLEYEARRALRAADAAALERNEDRISSARVAVFFVFVGIGVLAFRDSLAWAWLLAPAAAFIGLWAFHDRIKERLRLARAAMHYYEQGLERLAGRWQGRGKSGTKLAPHSHPYASDLDLFGEGSLFERLCLARTSAGQARLAEWLLAPATAARIAERQSAVVELRSRLDWRERLALLGEGFEAEAHPADLLDWVAKPPVKVPQHAWLVAAGLTLLVIASGVYWAVTDNRLYFYAALALQGAFALWARKPVGAILAELGSPTRDLELLGEVLAVLTSERFENAYLAHLGSQLDVDGTHPADQIRSLRRLVDLLDSRRNQMFAPFAIALMWGTHFAFAIERWRVRCGSGVTRWIAAVGELEAVGSLAGYAYENPEDRFPELREGEGTFLEGRGLGHPLLPRDRCVRNDVSLGHDVRLLLISGSNMSGKSTMMRTVGANVVLALTGAPVRAESLTLCPLAIGATIRVQDSLQEGASRFYAEVVRLRDVVDLTKRPLPVLFLLDEILHGTNSHDRLSGARALLRGLLERDAIGLVSTHDLALTKLASEMAPRARNVHFEDHFENGKMTFDYRMREGVITKSNALELMRSVGLEV